MNKIQLDPQNTLSFYDTPWNDNVLGYKTNEITNLEFTDEQNGNKLLKTFETNCINTNTQYTAFRVNSKDHLTKRILDNNLYSNIETSISVNFPLKKFKYNSFLEKLTTFKLNYASLEDIESIKNIASNEFNHGRFFEDYNIDKKLSKLRNSNWVDALYNNSTILVGKHNNTIFGFMTYKIDGSKATFELGGVSNSYSNFAYPFWYSILKLLHNNNIHNINTLISSSNIGVINLYSFFNFKFTDTYFGYRKIR